MPTPPAIANRRIVLRVCWVRVIWPVPALARAVESAEGRPLDQLPESE